MVTTRTLAAVAALTLGCAMPTATAQVTPEILKRVSEMETPAPEPIRPGAWVMRLYVNGEPTPIMCAIVPHTSKLEATEDFEMGSFIFQLYQATRCQLPPDDPKVQVVEGDQMEIKVERLPLPTSPVRRVE